ncbi:SUMF1/EgtB/PvdO family nonheme iron enzyme [Microcystis aeruginosa]|uniref:SUMF1/EgtB/PvdO family nonheme iron enzyme n=1 Tax=Microcystis aeruginosa FD4 TaxID=2686288 RepID=A0A857D2W7_MICAE|nr:SUMF1/EgtB/PvdO family nonheme iron enzyme [Microcystis aeruginosa]QGZ89952.1 SUMF1/EgtB/PvdO family nonheme iron enzyme [Microcystis aeruginosa FD4]
MSLNLPALPEKTGFWRSIWDKAKNSFNYLFKPQVYSSQILADTQRINTERNIEAQQERDKAQQELQRMQIVSQALQAKANLDLQMEQGELNRQLQLELAKLNQNAQAEQGILNRELQLKLTQLSQEFQAQQGKLNREHAEKLEILRGQLQKWALDQQKELQLHLKQLDAELARELRIFDRQTSLEVIKEQKREKNSPLIFVTEDLINLNPDEMRLLVLFSPPKIRQDNPSQSSGGRGFPDAEHALADYLREFFQKYTNQGRTIEFLPGAWTSKAFHSESAAKAIFRGLKTEPTLILEDLIEGNNLFINIAFWGLNWSKYRYQKAISLSWLETLFDFVKVRTLDWAEKRQAYQDSGKNSEQFDQFFGNKVVEGLRRNLSVLEAEQECLKYDCDPSEIERPYWVNEKDYQALIQFIAICHCLFAGMFIDEFFLLHVPNRYRKSPFLPQLLPDLIKDIPEEQQTELIEMVVASYEAMYQALEASESAWISELKLDLAESLSHFSNQFVARKQIDESIKAWLDLRQIDFQGLEPMEVLNQWVTIDDQAYIDRLNQCLLNLGEKRQLNVSLACYNRGLNYYQNREYQKAIFEFSQLSESESPQAEVFYYCGLTYSQLQNYSEAAKYFTRSLQIKPDWAEVHFELGKAYQKLGKVQQALAEYQQTLRLKPEFSEALSKLELEEPQQEFSDNLPSFDFQTVTVDSRGKEVKREKKQAQYFTENLGNGITLEMVAIPPGQFKMGSPDGQGSDDERPQHLVTVSAFFMGKYPITQAQWKAVASLPKIERDLSLNPSNVSGNNRPVEKVSWYDAVEFCQRLSKATGRDYRLPSEAQWEYACRGGTTTPFYFGETITPDLANYDGNSIYAQGPKGIYRQETTPVGKFPPNAFGLYDMHGNVWEWCADTWHDNYDGAPTDGSVWIENGDDNRSPRRGGSWYSIPNSCRSAYRVSGSRRDYNYYNGFRVVCGAGRTL